MNIIKELKDLESSQVNVQVSGVDVNGSFNGELKCFFDEDEESYFQVKNKNFHVIFNVDDIISIKNYKSKKSIIKVEM